MNQTILGLPFFEKNDISIHPKSRALRLPNITLQLTERMHTDGKISSLTSKKNQFFRNTSSFSVYPNTNDVITCSLPHHSYPDNTNAIVEPYAKIKNQAGLCVTSAIVTLKANETLSLAVLNVLPHKISVPRNTVTARITVLTPKQAEYLQPINPQLLSEYFNRDNPKSKFIRHQTNIGFQHRKIVKTLIH